jgi:hypothetical protein
MDRISGLPTKRVSLADVPGLPTRPPRHPLSREEALALRLTTAQPASDPSTVHRGSCHCGGVQLEIDRSLSAFSQALCHCVDCRVAHAANLYAVFYLEMTDAHHTPIVCVAGSEMIVYYHRPSSDNLTVRVFCSRCGSRVVNIGYLGVGSFPSIFDSFPFHPALHTRYGHSRFTVEEEREQRQLPRLVDWLTEWGGSGLVVQTEQH